MKIKKCIESCLVAGLFFLGSYGCPANNNQGKAGVSNAVLNVPDSIELFVKVKMHFVYAHGWGYCYKASVLNVLKGDMNDTLLKLTFGGRDFKEDMYMTNENVSIIKYVGFKQVPNENPYVSESGFIDSKNRTWKLIFQK